MYKARDTRLDRTVAIKVLPEHVAADPALKQRFEREAKTISSLNHPHICTLYDVGEQDGIDFIVMELVDPKSSPSRTGSRNCGSACRRTDPRAFVSGSLATDRSSVVAQCLSIRQKALLGAVGTGIRKH